MQNYNFSNSAGTTSQSVNTVLVAAAPAVEIARIDVASDTKLSVTFAVAAAALTGVTVLARGDKNARFIPIPTSELAGYGRSDSSSDGPGALGGMAGAVMITP